MNMTTTLHRSIRKIDQPSIPKEAIAPIHIKMFTERVDIRMNPVYSGIYTEKELDNTH